MCSEIESEWKLNVEPRGWQLNALEKWREKQKGIVSVVTGGGKTIFAQLCICEFNRKYPNSRVIIIVPTLTLLDQWYISLVEDLNVSQKDIACYSGQERSEKPSKINLCVINTARKLKNEIIKDDPVFLIVDECHRAGSKKNSEAIKGDYEAALGLSATPVREYDDGFEKYVSPSLGGIIYEYDYREAYHDGVICPFSLTNIKIDLLPDEEREYNKLTKRIIGTQKKVQKGDATEEQLKRLLIKRASIASSATMRIPAAAKIAELNHNKRLIIFHENVKSAENIYSILNKRNHNATIYHSKISPVVRRDNLLLFKRGIFGILVSCRALDEGMNVPEAEVAVIASSTSSKRQRIQRFGRVLRPSNSKEYAHIYTIYATKSELERLRQEESDLSDIAKIDWLNISLD